MFNVYNAVYYFGRKYSVSLAITGNLAHDVYVYDWHHGLFWLWFAFSFWANWNLSFEIRRQLGPDGTMAKRSKLKLSLIYIMIFIVTSDYI